MDEGAFGRCFWAWKQITQCLLETLSSPEATFYKFYISVTFYFNKLKQYLIFPRSPLLSICAKIETQDHRLVANKLLLKKHNSYSLTATFSGFGGLQVACWSLVPKFAGSNPAEAVGFFRAKKILSTPSFGMEVKPFVPCRRFTACKRSLNVTWMPGIFRQNWSAISRPISSSFH